MKSLLCFTLLVVLFGFPAGVAWADTEIDPNLSLQNSTCTVNGTTCFDLGTVGTNFSFMTFAAQPGGYQFDFTNGTGGAISMLTVMLFQNSLQLAGNYGCSVFLMSSGNTCSSSTDAAAGSSGDVTWVFNLSGTPIANGGSKSFFVQGSDSNTCISSTKGNQCFENPSTFNVSASVPEPGTLALLGSGLLGIPGVLRRRRSP